MPGTPTSWQSIEPLRYPAVLRNGGPRNGLQLSVGRVSRLLDTPLGRLPRRDWCVARFRDSFTPARRVSDARRQAPCQMEDVYSPVPSAESADHAGRGDDRAVLVVLTVGWVLVNVFGAMASAGSISTGRRNGSR